jgi:hypothetical protein
LYNYTDFKTTLVCVPILFIAPYFIYAQKYFEKSFSPKTGLALTDVEKQDELYESYYTVVHFAVLSILHQYLRQKDASTMIIEKTILTRQTAQLQSFIKN